MFIYITIAILVILLGLIIYKIINTEDNKSKMYYGLLGVSVLIFGASILFAELRSDNQDTNSHFPYYALAPVWISSTLAARNRNGVTNKKLNKYLILAMLLGLLVLMIITSLYIMK